MSRTMAVTRRTVIAVVAMVSGVSATIVTTSSAVRAFLGGATGKLVYTKLDCNDNSCNKRGHSLWYVDFSEAVLTERQIIRLDTAPWNEQGEPRNTVVSYDGQWVVFNTLDQDDRWAGSQLYACRLQANVTTRVSYGTGALPRLWQRPGTSEWYVIFNNKDLEENGGWAMRFPWSQVLTLSLRVNPSTMEPIGSVQQLLPYLANGNRSKSGAWMFAAGGVPGTFRINPTVVANAEVLEEVSLSVNAWDMYDSLDGCNPSMSPHDNDTELRVMYVCNDGDNNHRAYWICDVRGNNRRRVYWNCAENPYFDEPEWCPTHPDFGAAKASAEFLEAPFDIYLFRVWDAQYLKVLEGNYSFPYLWIDPNSVGVKPQPILKTSASVGFSPGHVTDICGRKVVCKNASQSASGVYIRPLRSGRARIVIGVQD